MICSYGPAHEVDVLACIAAGKPVFCEKPLTPTAEAALRIMEAEQAGGPASRDGRIHAALRPQLPAR